MNKTKYLLSCNFPAVQEDKATSRSDYDECYRGHQVGGSGSDEVTVEQRPGVSEGVSCAEVWGRSVSGTECSKARASEAVAKPVCGEQ